MVLNILSACKVEDRGVAVATASDDNAADGKIGSAIYHNCQVASTPVSFLVNAYRKEQNRQTGKMYLTDFFVIQFSQQRKILLFCRSPPINSDFEKKFQS